jgi:hypothetical protein
LRAFQFAKLMEKFKQKEEKRLKIQIYKIDAYFRLVYPLLW